MTERPTTPTNPESIIPVHVEDLREYYEPEVGSAFGTLLDNLAFVLHEWPLARNAMHRAARNHAVQPPNNTPNYNPLLYEEMVETQEHFRALFRRRDQLRRDLVNYLYANGGEPRPVDLRADEDSRLKWEARRSNHYETVAQRYGWVGVLDLRELEYAE